MHNRQHTAGNYKNRTMVLSRICNLVNSLQCAVSPVLSPCCLLKLKDGLGEATTHDSAAISVLAEHLHVFLPPALSHLLPELIVVEVVDALLAVQEENVRPEPEQRERLVDP